ncbi:unnamed protein product, partial [Ectocarpus fasciculatus]
RFLSTAPFLLLLPPLHWYRLVQPPLPTRQRPAPRTSDPPTLSGVVVVSGKHYTAVGCSGPALSTNTPLYLDTSSRTPPSPTTRGHTKHRCCPPSNVTAYLKAAPFGAKAATRVAN